MFNSQSARILYIEDDLVTATLVRELLDREGYIVDLASNGKEGFTKIKRGRCDIVIIDYRLPDMDGLQILKKIEKLKLPAIMVTAVGDERIAVEAMKLGVDDYLIKDTTSDYFTLLPSVIKRVLEKQRLSEEKDRAEKSLLYREAILTTVSFAAEKFLTSPHWEDHIDTVLERLGQAIAISRVSIFENQPAVPDQHSFLKMTQRYEWVAPYLRRGISKLHNRLYSDGFSRWQQVLSQGQTVEGLVKEFPETEALILAEQSVHSLVIIPIFVKDTWWGFMSYDDCVEERPWLPMIVESLRIAANTLGAAMGRTQIEEALRQSEERVRTFIESVDDVVYFQALDGALWFFNTTVTRITGYLIDEFTADPQLWRKLVHPDDLIIIETFFKRHPYGVSTTEMEYRLLTKAGTWRWIHSLMIGSQDKQGQYLGYNCIGRDITDRKQASLALRKERDFTKAILTTGAGLIVVLDSQGQIIRFNQACEKLTGYTAEEVEGRFIWDLFILPSEIDSVKAIFQRLITHGEFSNHHENYWLTKNGTPRLITWSNSVLLDEQGHVEYAIGTGIDITERKQVEEALRAREQMLRAVLEATTETVAMVEPDTTFVMINSIGAQRLNQTVTAIVGKSFYDLFPKEIAATRQTVVTDVIKTARSKRFEDQQEKFWFEHNVSPVLDEQGKVSHTAIVSRNITRRKEVEAVLLENKRRYKNIFDSVKVSIWEEDLYEVLQALETLRARGIVDLRQYLQENAYHVKQIISLVRVRNVNEATLQLFQVPTKQMFFDVIDRFFTDSTVEGFVEGLCAIWEGKHSFQVETNQRTSEGKLLTVMLSMPIPEVADDFHCIPVSMLDITERKRAEKALEESEEKYRTIINLTSEGYWLLEPTTQVILEVNESLCRMLDYAQPEMLGKTPFDFMDEDQWESLKIQATCAEVTDHYNGEIILRKKGGGRVFTNFSATTVYNSEGNVESVFAFITDITSRKQAETVLARTLLEQDIILNNSMVGIAFVSSDRRLRRLNRKLAEIFGYTQTELEGSKTQPLFPTVSDYIKVGHEILKTFQNGTIYSTERLMRRKNGELFWARMFGEYIDSKDILKGYIWSVEDITERRRADENLQLAATIFETVSEAIFVTNAENRILMVNPAFTLITGFSEADVLGQNPKILSSGRHSPEFYVEMWETLMNTGRWEGEIWNRRHNGEIYPEWLSITTIKSVQKGGEQHIAIFSDITKRKRDEETIQRQANFDALTELPNRILFMDRLTQEIRHALRKKNHLALMFIDLDHFKWVNDNLGHSAGDQLLQQVAARLTTCVRSADTVARLGGDEFTAILPNVETIWSVKMVAERILNQLASPFSLEGQEVFISGSVGIALFPQDGRDVDTLIKNADLAMFHAKKSGRSAYQFFTTSMNIQISEQRRLEKKLRCALEQDELILYYQPIIDLRSEQIVGVEALLRWQITEGELRLPSQFLDLAEDIGLIVPIAQWSLTTALNQLKTWHNKGLTSLQMAINLSMRQFRSKNIFNTLFEMLEKTKVPPHSITLEVTENLLFNDLTENIKKLNQLTKLGIQIAVDDFGIDYSSLHYIRYIPFNILKIDPSFIQNTTIDTYSAALGEAIITVAHKLGIKVVGEGVETVEQLMFLRKHQCDMAQGNYLSAPLTSEQFEDFVQTWQQSH